MRQPQGTGNGGLQPNDSMKVGTKLTALLFIAICDSCGGLVSTVYKMTLDTKFMGIMPSCNF